MPYQDLAEHTGTLVSIIGAALGISAILAAATWAVLWKLRATDKQAITDTLNLLRDDLKTFNALQVESLGRLEERLNSCQEFQKNCPLRFLTKENLEKFILEVRSWNLKLEQARIEAWKHQMTINERQETVNKAFLKMLLDHTHDENGKTLGVSPI